MKSKILLVNFTQKDAEELSDIGVEVERGFYGESLEVGRKELAIFGVQKAEIYPKVGFYSPHSVYEYRAVFIKIGKCDESFKDFSEKAERITVGHGFSEYWKFTGMLTVIIDEEISDLKEIGIPAIFFESANSGDLSIERAELPHDKYLEKTFDKLKNQIVIPPKNYIKKPKEVDMVYSDFGQSLKEIYYNRNGKLLGIFSTMGLKPSDSAPPGLLIIPNFKNNISAIKEILETVADAWPKFISGLFFNKWLNDDSHFPNDLIKFNKRIEEIHIESEKKIELIEKEKFEFKTQYEFLKGVLKYDGDELKDCVMRVLEEIFKLEVKDLDKNKSRKKTNDLLIAYGEKKYFAEVKGTIKSNPSGYHLTQVLQNLRIDGNIGDVGMLILNHDRNNEPKKRSKGYASTEEEKMFEGLVYLDTRVLFELSLAVIDHSLDLEEAKNILFSLGRVEFNLKKYLNDLNNV